MAHKPIPSGLFSDLCATYNRAHPGHKPPLTPIDRLLLAKINDSLQSDGTGYFASNSHIASHLSINVRHASRTISKLKDLGLIAVHYQQFNGKPRRYLTIIQGEFYKLKNDRGLVNQTAQNLAVTHNSSHIRTLVTNQDRSDAKLIQEASSQIEF